MQRGCFFFVAAMAVFTARVEAVDVVDNVNAFTPGFVQVVNFSGVAADAPVGDITSTPAPPLSPTPFSTVSFPAAPDGIFGTGGAGARNFQVGPPIVLNRTFTFTFDPPVDQVGFAAFPSGDTNKVDIKFEPANETLSFTPASGDIIGGRDLVNGISKMTLTVSPATGATLLSFGNLLIENFAPKIVVGPGLVNFSTVDVGTTSTPMNITVANTGNGALTVTALNFTGAYGLAAPAPSLPLVVAPLSTQDISLVFSPLTEGLDQGSVEVVSDAGNATVTLAGFGVGVPVIEVTPGTLAFGDTFVNTSKDLVLTVRNIGSAALGFTPTQGALMLPPENAPGPFEMTDFTTGLPIDRPIVVLAGGEVRLNVRFHPTSTGGAADQIQITHTALPPPNNVINVSLTGKGVPQLFAKVNVTPGSVSYGARFLGSTSSRTINVKNEGTGPLFVSSVALSGANRSQFSLFGAPGVGGAVLDGGESLRVTATYRPSQAGSHGAVVQVMSNDPDKPLTAVTLSGRGLIEEAPMIAVDPEAVDFGSVFVGASATQTVSITNDGTLPLTISAIALAQDGAAFSIAGEVVVPIELAPGATTTVDVVFTPSEVAEAVGELSIESDDEDNPTVGVALSGIGAPTPAPVIAVDTDPFLGFGPVQVGASVTLTATIRNAGVAILDVTSIALSEGTSAEFSYTGPADVSLVPGAALALEVAFTPVDNGFEGGSLVIMSGDPDQPVIEVGLSGTGVAEAVAKIDVRTPLALAFGQVQQGSPTTLVATIHNIGSAELEVTATTLAGSADFSITDGPMLPVVVAPGAQVTVTVQYNPSDLGFDSATLTIDSADAENPSVVVSITGVGVEATVPAIAVDTEAVDFGEVEIGSTPPTVTINIGNTGSGNLEVSAISLGDGSSDAFSVEDLVFPISVAPQAQAPVDLTFAPAEEGTVNGTVVIESNDPDDPAVTVTLSGSGIAAAAPGIGVDTETLEFGNVEIGSSNTLAFTVTNTGTQDLNLTSIQIGDGSSAAFTLGDIDVGSPSILMVGADPDPTFGADPTVFAMLSAAYGEAAELGDDGVFYMQGDVSTTEDAAMVDLLLISSSLNSGTVRGKFQDTPTAVLNYESALMDASDAGDFQLSEGGATSDGHTQLDIVAPGHPLAAGLEGTVDVFTEPNTLSVGTGAVGAGVTVIARATSDTSLLGIFAAEAGAELLGDGSEGRPATAAGRRVMFFLQDVGADFLTEDGQALFFAAIEWLVELPVDVIGPGDSVQVDVTYSPTEEVTDTGTVQIESNAGDLSVALSGTGVPAAVMQIRIAPPSVDFGGTLIGSTSNADITIRNLGTANLDLSGVSIGTGSSLNFNITAEPQETTVAPGTETIVKVSYTPKGTLTDSGTVRIASNDTKHPSVAVSLFGFGTGDSSAPVFKRGDANSDATVDISDVVKTLMFLFGGGSEPACYDAADSNDDGALDISDGLFTVRRLFGGSDQQTPPPPVSNSCVIDGTGDSLPDCNYPLDACGL